MNPHVTPLEVSARPQVDLARAAELARELFGVHGEVVELGSHQDRNFRVSTPDGPRVLKVANRSWGRATIEAQNAALRAHRRRATPASPRPSRWPAWTEHDLHEVEVGDDVLPVRLLTYVEGTPLSGDGYLAPARRRRPRRPRRAHVSRRSPTSTTPASTASCSGTCAAPSTWSRRCSRSIADPDRRALVADRAAAAAERLDRVADTLRVQAIHGDVTDDNVVGRARRRRPGPPRPASSTSATSSAAGSSPTSPSPAPRSCGTRRTTRSPCCRGPRVPRGRARSTTPTSPRSGRSWCCAAPCSSRAASTRPRSTRTTSPPPDRSSPSGASSTPRAACRSTSPRPRSAPRSGSHRRHGEQRARRSPQRAACSPTLDRRRRGRPLGDERRAALGAVPRPRRPSVRCSPRRPRRRAPRPRGCGEARLTRTRLDTAEAPATVALGVDLAVPAGTRVVAPADVVVATVDGSTVAVDGASGRLTLRGIADPAPSRQQPPARHEPRDRRRRRGARAALRRAGPRRRRRRHPDGVPRAGCRCAPTRRRCRASTSRRRATTRPVCSPGVTPRSRGSRSTTTPTRCASSAAGGTTSSTPTAAPTSTWSTTSPRSGTATHVSPTRSSARCACSTPTRASTTPRSPSSPSGSPRSRPTASTPCSWSTAGPRRSTSRCAWRRW